MIWTTTISHDVDYHNLFRTFMNICGVSVILTTLPRMYVQYSAGADHLISVPQIHARFVQYCSTAPLPSLDTYFESAVVDTNMSALGRVKGSELHHYASALHSLQLKKKANYDRHKEWQIYAFLLDFLAVQEIHHVTCALSVNGVSRHYGYVT